MGFITGSREGFNNPRRELHALSLRLFDVGGFDRTREPDLQLSIGRQFALSVGVAYIAVQTARWFAVEPVAVALARLLPATGQVHPLFMLCRSAETLTVVMTPQPALVARGVIAAHQPGGLHIGFKFGFVHEFTPDLNDFAKMAKGCVTWLFQHRGRIWSIVISIVISIVCFGAAVRKLRPLARFLNCLIGVGRFFSARMDNNVFGIDKTNLKQHELSPNSQSRWVGELFISSWIVFYMIQIDCQYKQSDHFQVGRITAEHHDPKPNWDDDPELAWEHFDDVIEARKAADYAAHQYRKRQAPSGE